MRLLRYARACFWDCPDSTDPEERTINYMQRVLVVALGITLTALLVHNAPWALVAILAAIVGLGALYAD